MCTVFFIIIIIIVGSLLFSGILWGVPDLWRVGFLFKLECWSSTPEFYKDYFTMFAVCASFCVSISPLARASSVRSVAKSHPERHDRATQPLLTAYIWIEAQCFLWGHRSPPWETQSPGHCQAQTHINSGCKAFVSSVVAVVRSVFVLREARACDGAFFHP